MKTVAVVLLAAAPALLAQQRSANPFGRIVFPGGNPPPSGVQMQQPSRGSIVFPGGGAPYVPRPTFGGSVWTTAPLKPPKPVHDHDRRPGAIAYPVAVPVYAGGYYPYDPPPAQVVYAAPATPFTAAVQPPEQPAPVVIINQYFRADEPPVTETAQAATTATAAVQTTPAAPSRQETIFMIAMKDHNVYTANAYWIEDGALHFISTDGDERRVSMNEVDRDLSRRLNRDRNVAFGLPAN